MSKSEQFDGWREALGLPEAKLEGATVVQESKEPTTKMEVALSASNGTPTDVGDTKVQQADVNMETDIVEVKVEVDAAT